MKIPTNEELIIQMQNRVILRGDTDPDYPIERHMEDMDFIAELTELKRKLRGRQHESD